MSGLETLPPDQRAVLQLILRQGHGYAQLGQMLKIDAGAVRTRAHAGLDALAPDARDALGPVERAQIGDYLLGQQDEGERIVTLAELAESAPASRWARTLRERLAPLARDPLPTVPAPVSANGAAAVPLAPVPPPPAPAELAASPPPRSSRLGGAILIAGVAAALVVLAIVLFTGGDDAPAPSATTTTPARTQPSTTGSTTPTPPIAGQVNLSATPAGGQAIGIGIVQRSDGKLALAIEAQKLPANGAQDIYAAWVEGPGGTKFLGFVPKQVKENGTFTVSATLPSNARQLATVLITREATSGVPTAPGEAILRGTIAFRTPAG